MTSSVLCFSFTAVIFFLFLFVSWIHLNKNSISSFCNFSLLLQRQIIIALSDLRRKAESLLRFLIEHMMSLGFQFAVKNGFLPLFLFPLDPSMTLNSKVHLLDSCNNLLLHRHKAIRRVNHITLPYCIYIVVLKLTAYSLCLCSRLVWPISNGVGPPSA